MADRGESGETRPRNKKSPQAFRTISEVALELDVPQHVLRFWETKFSQIKPMKRGGGRRYYRPEDLDLLTGIKQLLYNEGYTIKGVQKLFSELGAKAIVQAGKTPQPGPKSADADMDDGDDVAATSGVAASAPEGLTAEQRGAIEGMIDELQGLRASFTKALGKQ